MKALIPLLLAASHTAFAASATEAQHTATTTTHLTEAEQHQAQQWNLSDAEWQQYKEAKAGPRGIWSPNLDPLTTLGISARTDQERRRYAELLVRQERQRVEGEIAFQKAYDEAFARLTPNLLPVGSGAQSQATVPTGNARLTVFVSDQCAPCNSTVERLIKQGTSLDIYMVGSKGDDKTIRAWAKSVAIDPKKVRAREITLNHDNGRWFDLTGLAGVLPGIYRMEAGQWKPVAQ